MAEDNWQRVAAFAAFVDEVNAEAIHISAKLGQLVELGLLCPPVELIVPVIRQTLQVIEVRAVVSACTTDFIRPARSLQALLQVVKHCFRYLYLERFHAHVSVSSH